MGRGDPGLWRLCAQLEVWARVPIGAASVPLWWAWSVSPSSPHTVTQRAVPAKPGSAQQSAVAHGVGGVGFIKQLALCLQSV